jgi:Ni/Co efflux regulator RcnB
MSLAALVRPSPRPSPPLPMRERVSEDEARAMLRAVLNLFDKWGVERGDQITLLGSPSERTFQRWRAGEIGGLSVDTVYRLGDLLGVHKALRYMFAEPERGYAWVKRGNAAFGGASALAVMRQGAPGDISRVRAYLDAERGGW